MSDNSLSSIYAWRDPVQGLRLLADQIEAGKFGKVEDIVMVLDGDIGDGLNKLMVMAMGDGCEAERAVYQLQRGITFMAMNSLAYGE